MSPARSRALMSVRSSMAATLAQAAARSAAACARVAAMELRTDIKALDRAGLIGVIAEAGEPAFRAGQIVRWLYGRGAASFDEMSDLSAGLRAMLVERFT